MMLSGKWDSMFFSSSSLQKSLKVELFLKQFNCSIVSFKWDAVNGYNGWLERSLDFSNTYEYKI